MASHWARGEPGADTSLFRGETRAVVEASLGRPFQEWGSADGFTNAVYLYDSGRPAHPYSWPINQILAIPYTMFSGDPCAAFGPKFRPGCEASLRHEKRGVVMRYDRGGKVSEIVLEEDWLRRFPDEETQRMLGKGYH